MQHLSLFCIQLEMDTNISTVTNFELKCASLDFLLIIYTFVLVVFVAWKENRLQDEVHSTFLRRKKNAKQKQKSTSTLRKNSRFH